MSFNRRSCHYETLGVPKDATLEEIKAAFRKLSLLTHPDVAGAGACPERFKRISHAASILTNLKQKKAYDQSITTSYQYNPMQQFHRSTNSTYRRKEPSGMTAILVQLCHPRNLILGPVALFISVSAIQYLFGMDDEERRHKQPFVSKGEPLVQAWKNPTTGQFETPAPWDPVYRQLQPELQYVPRDQVRSRNL
jgi:curved DNA-binding protein CbpA